MQQTLREGGVIDGDILYETIQSQLDADNLHPKGFLMEGIPMNIKSHNISQQLEQLASIIKKFNCVLVDLRISDQDLLRRKVSSWVDPATNISYPGQQVVYSRKRRQEGWAEGEEDSVYIAERQTFNPQSKEKNQEDQIDDDDEPKETEIIQGPPKLFKNRVSYPILSEKMLDRLIKLPENDPERVSAELLAYKRIEEKMEEIKAKYFHSLKIVELDASQHPEQILDQMKVRMDARGYSIYTPFYEVHRLQRFASGE